MNCDNKKLSTTMNKTINDSLSISTNIPCAVIIHDSLFDNCSPISTDIPYIKTTDDILFDDSLSITYDNHYSTTNTILQTKIIDDSLFDIISDVTCILS